MGSPHPPRTIAPHNVEWLFEKAPDASFLTDRHGLIVYANPAFEALTGYTRREVVGCKPSILKSGVQSDGFYRDLWHTLLAGGEFSGVIVNRRKDGSTYHEEKSIWPLFDAGGGISHFVATGRDVSGRIAAAERTAVAATHDALTGLPNRALFLDRLERAVAQARRNGQPFTVARVDIDPIKADHDASGPAAGDTLLCAVAQRLRRSVRAADTVARLDGNDFGVLLGAVADRHAAAQSLGRIVRAIGAPMLLEFGPVAPRASIGACAWTAKGGRTDASVLLRCADFAMYRCKLEGGHGWRLHGDDEPDNGRARGAAASGATASNGRASGHLAAR